MGATKGALVFFSDLAGDEGGGMGGWPMEGGEGGEMGGGAPEQKVHWFPLFWLPSKPNNWSDLAGNNWSDLAGDEGGGMGGGVGRWPMEGGEGGEMGGGHQRAVWEQQKGALVPPFLGSLKNLTTGLIWLVTRVGGWGEAWGGGPWRAGKGGDGGAAIESSAKGALVPLGSLKNLATGLIWLVTRVGGWGEAWGGGPWRAGKGGDGGGGTREQCGSNKRCTVFFFFFFFFFIRGLVTRVAGWGEAWGGGPWTREQCGSNNLGSPNLRGGVGRWLIESGQGEGGRWGGGGHQRAVWEQQKVHWFPFFGLP